MLETSFPPFIGKKSGEIPMFRSFWRKMKFLACISLKIGNLGEIANYDVNWDVVHGVICVISVCVERRDP